MKSEVTVSSKVIRPLLLVKDFVLL